MQLATTGFQDTILTGNPDISYYQKVFTSRATYKSEVLRLAFDTGCEFGKTTICTLGGDTCDIITGFYIKFSYTEEVELPQDTGHAYIDNVSLLVGGQTIISLSGEYLAITSDLKDSQRTRKNYENILRRNATPRSYGTAVSATTAYVEIPFFGKGYRDSFPLVALKRHPVQIKLTMRNSSEFVTPPVTPQLDLIVQAIYLDGNHKKMFTDRPLNYIVHQAQVASLILGSLNQLRFATKFDNPVKEFLLVVQNDTGTFGPFDYSAKNSDLYTSFTNDQVEQWKMYLNGQLLFDLDKINMRTIEPYKHYTQTPSYKTNVYNIGQGDGPYPSGTINMSRVANQVFELKLTPANFTRKARLYATTLNVFRCMGGLGGLMFI